MISLNKKSGIALILIIVILIELVIPILTKSNKVYAATKTCGDANTFGDLMRNANDGDVIRITNNMTLGSSSKFRVKDNCLVTLDLDYHSITFSVTDVFDVGANSTLLVKNGTLDKLDTANNSAGIMILDNVNVTGNVWLGRTVAWVINNSRIGAYSTEQGSINRGVSNLHPIGSGVNGSNYNYENAAPAMIGSGTSWTIDSSISNEFNAVNNNSTKYSNIILLRNSELSSDANLIASNITMDFSEYTLATGDYFIISNDSGTNIIRNGTINGNIDMTTGSGNVSFSNMIVNGDINNNSHTINIASGTYKNIYGGTETVTITGGYFYGDLSGDSYEISGGYFVDKPDSSYLKEGCLALACDVTSGGVNYNYYVAPAHTITFDANGHGTAPSIQEVEKGHAAIKPTDLIEEKYTFGGWYEESECTNAYNFDTPVNSDMTLFAKWTLNIITDDMVSISDNIQTYDGAEYSINVTNSSDATITYGLIEGEYDLGELPKYTDTGTYKIYYKAVKDNYVDRTGSATLTIDPAIITEISFGDNEITYDGQAHTAIVTGELPGGTIKYGTTEGVYNLNKIPKFTDAGTYTIYYKATKNNYIDKVGSATVKINPRLITVKAKDKTITYEDDTPIFDYEITNGSLVSGEELSNINVSQLNETEAGTYTITVSQVEGSNLNYDITFEEGTFTINKKGITPEVELNQTTFTYNLEEQKPEVYVKINGNDLPTSEYTVQFTDDSTNVGNKQVRVLSTANNYTFTEISKDYVINPKAIDSAMVTIERSQYVYDTKTKEPEIIVKHDGTLLNKDSDYEILDTSTLSATNAGNYSITIKGKGNYGEEYTAPWTITKAQITGVTIEGVDTIYDGKSHKIDVTIPDNAKISFKTDIDSEYSDENPKFKNVGNYVVYYKIEIDNNYEVIENAATVIIEPKDVEVSVDNKEKVYSEDDPELTYTATGLVGLEKLEGITLSRELGEDVGVYSIKAAKDTSKDTNYNIELINGTLKINKKETSNPTVIITNESIIYTGNKIEPSIIVKDDNDSVIPDSEYTISYSNNIDAGEAKITIANKDGGNYIVNGKTTFTIDPKVVNDPKIEFDQTEYKYTGSEIEPDITIRDDDTIIPANEYTLSYLDNIDAGTATVTIKNKDNSNYVFETTGKFEIVKPGTVQISENEVQNANNTKIGESVESLYSKIEFTEEELEKQARGKNIDIYMEVNDVSESISEEDKKLVTEKIAGEIGACIDINLFKQIAGEEATEITKTKEPISISFDIPKNLINNDSKINRTYMVIRIDEGVVNLLKSTVKDNVITFETDKISTYILAYSDDDVITKIELIDIQRLIGSKSRIVSARDSYDALTETQKEFVTNYENLVNAENEYNRLYNQAVSNSKNK